jgi:glycerol-3-phosphate cytidylyltransferase-like family protein
MSREFVDAVVAGDNIIGQQAFKDAVSDKVGETLEVKRREYAKTFVSTLPQAVEDDD